MAGKHYREDTNLPSAATTVLSPQLTVIAVMAGRAGEPVVVQHPQPTPYLSSVSPTRWYQACMGVYRQHSDVEFVGETRTMLKPPQTQRKPWVYLCWVTQ